MQIVGIVGALALVGIAVGSALPRIVRWLGYAPVYEAAQYDLMGKRAMVVATNHGVLGPVGADSGKATGVYASELTHPYYAFLDAGMEVDVVSIEGGPVPVDPQSVNFVTRTPDDRRYLDDPCLQAKLRNSLRAEDVDFTEYDAIVFAGGWGAAYDLGYSDVIGRKVSEAYYAGTPLIGSLCHGALGLIRAKDRDGEALIAGRRVTGVTDKQVHELGITVTPQHPETELRKAGACFEAQSAFRDMFATHVVVDDERRFVTGQNQNSGHEMADKMMAIIAERSAAQVLRAS